MGRKGWQVLLVGSLFLGAGLFGLGMLGRNKSVAIAAEANQSESRGNRIRLNGQTLRGNWTVWQENGEMRLGVESMGLEKSLGIRLLDTQDSSSQPVAWFEEDGILPVKFTNPYRYLDITELATAEGWQWQSQGDILALRTPTAKILNIRQGNQTWGQRIVLDLDRPMLWRQETPTKLTVQGTLASFATGQAADSKASSPVFRLKSKDQEITFDFSAAIAPQIQVTTLANPPRLIIDLRQDSRPSRTVEWLPGMTWRQQNVVLPGKNNGGFGVTWVELDPTRSNLKLAPVSPSNQTIVGLAPMITQAKTNGAIAAINAGFFNRNNQYPLGAVRENLEWRSSPILNRGAIAWDNRGNWLFDRLTLREDLIANNGERLTVDFLNSGYVKAGVSRYTEAWGSQYQPVIDNEVILTIRSEAIVVPETRPDQPTRDTVIRRDAAQKAGQGSYPIPKDGYLLVFRSFRSGADKLPLNTQFQLSTAIVPYDFEYFPNVMGGGPLLVQNGRVVLNGESEQFSKAFNSQSASRSAIARTRDNKIILATVHGTALESSGATLREWSDILLRLGATDALNLDGGGSSALVVGGDLGDRHSSSAGRVNNAIGVFLEQR